MELASQECCLHRILFTCRYVTFVLVIITIAFTLYSVVVLEKNRTRTTIFNSLGSTGDTGRQPPLLPPQLAATRVDTIIHNYRPSTSL